MFRWAFLFLVAGLLVWMFADSKATRWIGLGVLAFIAVFFGAFFHVLDRQERNQAGVSTPDKTIAEVEDRSRKQKTARFALKPADVALLKRTLTPGQRTVWTAEGQRRHLPDLFSWNLSGEARNLSSEHTVRDLSLRVRLYDCPVFFTAPAHEVDASQLERECSLIGERTLGLYSVGIEPGETRAFSESVRFNDQTEPRNWRYRIEVDGVSAVAE